MRPLEVFTGGGKARSGAISFVQVGGEGDGLLCSDSFHATALICGIQGDGALSSGDPYRDLAPPLSC